MSIDDILFAVAVYHYLSVADLTSRSRRQHIAHARQTAAWVLREAVPALSLEAIGELLGGLDHTTVMYALERVEQRMAADPVLAADLRRLAVLAPVRTPKPTDPAMRWWAVQGRTGWKVSAA